MMKIRSKVIFLLPIIVVAIAIMIAINFVLISEAQTGIIQQGEADPPGTIYGEYNPEKIPDWASYTLLFRLIANRQTDRERIVIRDFLKEKGFGSNCSVCPQTSFTNGDIDVVIRAAEEFHKRISVIDKKANDIKDATWHKPTQEALLQLSELQKLKEAICKEVILSMRNSLSETGKAGLERQNVNFKKHMKAMPLPNDASARSPN